MATTTQGRELTTSHRIAQVHVGQDTRLEAGALWPMLDRHDLDRSTPGWVATVSLSVASRHRQSQQLAVAYLGEYRQAELGTPSGPVRRPRLSTASLHGVLVSKGPVLVKRLISQGVPLDAAMRQAEASSSAWAAQFAMGGGRSTIDQSSRADRRARRYRRVSDGDPCTFCAMLVTRGFRYSEESAFFRSHPHCGCTAEPGYGFWEPDDLEQEWLDSYVEASKEAKEVDGVITESTVLWRMRRNRPDLFSDGVYPLTA